MQLPTIEEVCADIPKHCFKASVMRTCAFIVRDLSFVASLAFSALLDPAMSSVWQDPLGVCRERLENEKSGSSL
jgi:hypothetical protein